MDMEDFNLVTGHGSDLDHEYNGRWGAASPRARRLVLAFILAVLVVIVAIGVFVVTAVVRSGLVG